MSHPLYLSKWSVSMYTVGPSLSFYLLLSVWSFLKLATSSDEYCEDAVGCVAALTGSSLSVFHTSFYMWL